MRTRKEIKKAHALNKRVRREKARLRKRRKAKKELKPTIKPQPRIHIRLDGEHRLALLKYCNEHNVKPYKAVRQILRKAMEDVYIENLEKQ